LDNRIQTPFLLFIDQAQYFLNLFVSRKDFALFDQFASRKAYLIYFLARRLYSIDKHLMEV